MRRSGQARVWSSVPGGRPVAGLLTSLGSRTHLPVSTHVSGHVCRGRAVCAERPEDPTVGLGFEALVFVRDEKLATLPGVGRITSIVMKRVVDDRPLAVASDHDPPRKRR
jgi:hypothetical protein